MLTISNMNRRHYLLSTSLCNHNYAFMHLVTQLYPADLSYD